MTSAKTLADKWKKIIQSNREYLKHMDIEHVEGVEESVKATLWAADTIESLTKDNAELEKRILKNAQKINKQDWRIADLTLGIVDADRELAAFKQDVKELERLLALAEKQ